jgi:hypothetical protein
VEIINKQSLTIDLKKTTMIPLPQFIQHDTNVLEFIILENGVAADLTNIGRIVVKYKRPDGLVVDRLLVPQGNTISYEIGISEMQLPGFGQLELHFYNLTNAFRISTKKFKVYLSESIGATYIESEQLGVLQELFVEVQELNALVNDAEELRQQNEATRQNQEAQRQTDTTNKINDIEAKTVTAINNVNTNTNSAIGRLDAVTNANKSEPKPPVVNFAAIATTYPNPQLGWKVQTLDNGNFYRYQNGAWEWVEQITGSAIVDIQNNLAQTNRRTQTLIAGPYNVLNSAQNAPVNIQIEGRTLIPMQNNVLEASKFYVLADKRTKLEWADTTTTQGVAKFTGKAEKPRLIAIANFEDKKTGSTLENPHIMKTYDQGNVGLPVNPSVLSLRELVTQSRYDQVKKLGDTALDVDQRTAAGEQIVRGYTIDVVQEIERRYGRIPRATLAEKIQWAKDNVVQITGYVHGLGASPAGNKLTFVFYTFAGSAGWVSEATNTTGTISKLTRAITTSVPNAIDPSGFVHFMAYADPATGVPTDPNGGASTMTIDYFECEIKLKPDAVLHDPRVPLYEVTQQSYDAILNTWSEDEVVRRYPSVAGPTHLQNLYLMATGENIADIRNSSRLITRNNAVIINDNGINAWKIDNVTSSDQLPNIIDTPFLPNTQYSIRAKIKHNGNNGRLRVAYTDGTFETSASNALATDYFETTLITAAGKTISTLGIHYTTSGGTLYIDIDSFVVSIGATLKPYVPYNPSYLFFETKLAEIRGVTADRVFEQDGKYFKRKNIETVELDGSLAWSFYSDGAAFKTVKTSYGLLGVEGSEKITKYNGLSLKSKVLSFDNKDQSYLFSSHTNTGLDKFLFISISDTDTGFGETHTPTTNELKGYFNGWKAKTVDANGKPTAWMSLGDGTDAPTQTEVYVKDNKAPNYTPGKLMYQLTTPITEEIKHEGSIFANSLTMVEVSSGAIIREKVVFQKGTTYASLARSEASWENSLIKYRNLKIIALYEGDKKVSFVTNSDAGFVLAEDNRAQGKQRITARNEYIKDFEYTLTYIVWDKQTFTSNPVNVTAQYANNIRTALEDTAKKVEDVATETTVIKNTYAKKSKYPWIAPTLLNSWVNFGGVYAAVGYTKDDFGFVHLRGLIKSGVTAQAAFILPVGFRPEKDLLIATTSNGAFGQLSIRTDGQVFVESGSNINFSLENIAFRVEG